MTNLRLLLQSTLISIVALASEVNAQIQKSCASLTLADLPTEIYWRGKCLNFNSYYYFAIIEGKIWSKSRQIENAQWELYQGSGLPQREGDRFAFLPPEEIIQISADDDEIVALDSEYQIYFDRIEKTMRFDDSWYAVWGAPTRQDLVFPLDRRDNLGWAIGRRRQNSTAMSTDIVGNEHWSYIGITTMYLLDKNGQDIYFADTGLPAEMAHQMCGPNRNQEKMLAISASGSTMMVLTHAGEVLTRLEDFDTKGGNPAFAYTYDQSAKAPSSSFGSPQKTQVRVLPGHSWQLHAPLPPLEGQRSYTSLISIFQNGQGNEARELRVFGTNTSGQWGFYYKGISGEHWQFKLIDEKSAMIISQFHQVIATANAPFARKLGAAEGETLTGEIQWNLKEKRSFHLDNFSWVCSPATITFQTASDESISGELHFTDAWNPMRHLVKGEIGALTGHHSHAQLGNLVFPTETIAKLESSDPELATFIGKKNFEAFNLWIEGDESAITGRNLRGPRLVKITASNPEIEQSPNIFNEVINDPSLIYQDGIVTREQALQANKELLATLDEYQHDMRLRKLGIGLFRLGIGTAYSIYHGLGIGTVMEIKSRMLDNDEQNNFDKKKNGQIRRNEVLTLFNKILKMVNRYDRREFIKLGRDIVEAKQILKQRIRELEN